jgi:predicted molibdopterin-dependent oxidoreductase YjgC
VASIIAFLNVRIVLPTAASGEDIGPFVVNERKPASKLDRMRTPLAGSRANCCRNHSEPSYSAQPCS